MHRRNTAIFFAGLAVASGIGGIAMQPISSRPSCLSDLKLCTMQAAGSLAGVNRTQDTYADFYVTKLEVVGKNNVHPKQLWDLYAAGESFRLVTAVQEQAPDKFRQRAFIATWQQAANLKEGDRITVFTLGQYLAPTYPIYPVIQKINTAPADELQLARVHAAIKAGQVDGGYVVRAYKGLNP